MFITVLLIPTICFCSNLKKYSFLCNTLRYLTIDMFSLDALVLDQLNLMTMIEIILMKLAVNDFLAT